MTSSRSQRGATLVEYALGVALLVVPLIFVVNNAVDAGTDNLEDRSTSAGSPDGAAFVIPPESGGTSNGGGGSSPGPGTGEVTDPQGSFSQGDPASKWNANYQVTIVDPTTNQPVAGATLTIGWTPSNRGSGGEECITDANGVCSVIRDGINDNSNTVTASVTSLNGVVIAASASGPVTVTCTTPAC